MGSSGADLDRAAADLDVRLSRTRALPFLGDGQHTNGINLVQSYAELCAVSLARAKFLGELLAEQYRRAQDAVEHAGGDEGGRGGSTGVASPRDPSAGLIGFTGMGLVVGSGDDAAAEFVPTGEEVRALEVLESRERDRAARLIEQARKMGVELDQVEVLRSYADAVIGALEAMTGELGLSMDSEPVLRSARRAGMIARRRVGHDDGDPELVGRRITPDERVAALRAALAVAEREQAEASRAIGGPVVDGG